MRRSQTGKGGLRHVMLERIVQRYNNTRLVGIWGGLGLELGSGSG